MDNPLLNHKVVAKVLNSSSLNFEDIKSFRLVCTLWYKESLQKWRSSVVVRLRSVPFNNPMWDRLGALGPKITDLNALYSENDDDLCNIARNPFIRYRLSNWFTGYYGNNNAKTAWRNVISPSVEWLHVDYCHFHDSKELEAILFACNNLQELIISSSSSGICRCCKIDNVKHEVSMLPKLLKLTISGGMPIQWAQLLLHAPNLQSLTIKQSGSYGRATFPSFLIDLHQLEYCGRNPNKITHLDIMDADKTFIDFVSLSSRNLSLQSLSFCFDNDRPEHFISPLLQAHARTLTVLKLNYIEMCSNHVDTQEDFPYGVSLLNLKEFYVWGNLIKNWNFLKNMPNLNKLFISRDIDKKADLGEVENINLEEMNNVVFSSLQEFQVDCKFKPENVQNLQKLMPNLKRLKFVLTKETSNAALKVWPSIIQIVALEGSELEKNCNALKGQI